MITYELAKQLKDSGFPEKVVEIPKHNFDGRGCYPTLSELIEACGDRFEMLDRWDSNDWVAREHKDGGEGGACGKGSTPEEAVVRLWLALNKK